VCIEQVTKPLGTSLFNNEESVALGGAVYGDTETSIGHSFIGIEQAHPSSPVCAGWSESNIFVINFDC
jgi:hypothetical protein